MDIHGEYEGGGQCDECEHYTTGTNCHTCVDGYFRPPGVAANDSQPCIPCDCPVRQTSPYSSHVAPQAPEHTGRCEAGGGQCECKDPWKGAPDCSACARVGTTPTTRTSATNYVQCLRTRKYCT